MSDKYSLPDYKKAITINLDHRQYNQALNNLKKAYAIDPDDYELNYYIGKAYYGLRNYSHAKKIFNNLLDKKPEDTIAKLYLAYCYYFTGLKSNDVSVSQQLAREVNNKEPNNIYAVELLADTYLFDKRHLEALELYNSIEGKADSNSRIIYKEALCLYGLEHYAEGLVITDQLYRNADIRRNKNYKVLYQKMLAKRKEQYFKDNGAPTWTQSVFSFFYDQNFTRELLNVSKAEKRSNHVERVLYNELYTDDKGTGCRNAKYYTAKRLSWFKADKAFTLGFTDIDKFKNINDEYGHAVGDIVIRNFVKIGQEVFSREFYRVGGEEFIFLIEGSIQEASLKAEEFRSMVELKLKGLVCEEYNGEKPMRTITCSTGLAEYKNDGKTEEEVRTMADARLYEAKYSGRNKVIWQGQGLIAGKKG